MSISKRIIFIIAIICFITGAFFVSASAQEMPFVKIIKTKLIKQGGGETTKNIDLKLRNKYGRWRDSVTKTWKIEGAMPGQTKPLRKFRRLIQLRNKGNVEAKRLIISLENTSEELGNEESDTKKGLDGAEGMDEYVEIVKLKYGNWWWQKRDLKKELDDLNGNGFIDLDDFENYNSGNGFDDLEPPCIGNYPFPKPYSMEALFEWAKKPRKYFCRIKQMSVRFRLHPSTSNDFQGDRVLSDIEFILTNEPK